MRTARVAGWSALVAAVMVSATWLAAPVRGDDEDAGLKRKALALNVGHMDHDTARKYTAETIAALRVSPEGQEGLRSFLEKRKPNWVINPENTR